MFCHRDDSIRRDRLLLPATTTLVHQGNLIQENTQHHTELLNSLDTKLDRLSLSSLHCGSRQETLSNDINAKWDAMLSAQNHITQQLRLIVYLPPIIYDLELRDCRP